MQRIMVTASPDHLGPVAGNWPRSGPVSVAIALGLQPAEVPAPGLVLHADHGPQIDGGERRPAGATGLGELIPECSLHW
jgi:hypothetical protein